MTFFVELRDNFGNNYQKCFRFFQEINGENTLSVKQTNFTKFYEKQNKQNPTNLPNIKHPNPPIVPVETSYLRNCNDFLFWKGHLVFER